MIVKVYKINIVDFFEFLLFPLIMLYYHKYLILFIFIYLLSSFLLNNNNTDKIIIKVEDFSLFYQINTEILIDFK